MSTTQDYTHKERFSSVSTTTLKQKMLTCKSTRWCFQKIQNCTVTQSAPVLFCDIFVHWLNWRKVLNISQSLANNNQLEFHNPDQWPQNLKHFPQEGQFTFQCSSKIWSSTYFPMFIWATGSIALSSLHAIASLEPSPVQIIPINQDMTTRNQIWLSKNIFNHARNQKISRGIYIHQTREWSNFVKFGQLLFFPFVGCSFLFDNDLIMLHSLWTLPTDGAPAAQRLDIFKPLKECHFNPATLRIDNWIFPSK